MIDDKELINLERDLARLLKVGFDKAGDAWNQLHYREIQNKLFRYKEALMPYKVFHDHVANHKEVQEAPHNPGQVMCKVCYKTFKQIVNSKSSQ